MIAHIRRGAALTAMVAAIGALTVTPAAAEETTTTVDALLYAEGSQSPAVTGQWSITRSNPPWPVTSTSLGSAITGRTDADSFRAWLVEFRLPDKASCIVESAELSVYTAEYVDDTPFRIWPLEFYPGSGNPTATLFDGSSGFPEFTQFVPDGNATTHTLDVTDAVTAFVAQLSTTLGVRAPAMHKPIRAWGAPFDSPDTRPALTVTCAPDDDRDGVANTDDICPKTALPDRIQSLSKVKYAANSSGVFRSGAGATPGLSLDHTAGCSAIQIGQRLGPVVELDVRLWGLALNKLQKWADTH